MRENTLQTPVEECIERDGRREEKRVGEETIRRMEEKMEVPEKKVRGSNEEGTLRCYFRRCNVIIVGCLSEGRGSGGDN